MPTRDLLPGVTSRSCPPRVACDAKAAIRKARHRALVRDAVQVTLLVAVDWLFVHWPESHVPFLGRGESMIFLRGVNALIFFDLWLSRAMPKWWAKRIASTWSRAERDRFNR